MSLSFTCPECDTEHDLPQSMVGKKFACSCGAVLEIEAASVTAATCPACEEEIPAGNVLCTNCGYNVETGRSVAATGDYEDGATVWENYVDPAVPSPQPPVGQFLRHYLSTLGCATTSFESEGGGGGMFSAAVSRAEISADSCHGRWEQTEGIGLIATHDRLVVASSGLDVDVFKDLGLFAPGGLATE